MRPAKTASAPDLPALLALAAQALEQGAGHLQAMLRALARVQRQGGLEALQGPGYRIAHAHAQAWAA
ncbi:MAG TPA: hypothetical protein VL359_20150, partial [bacterium]|nr:hypothetical protein [bacterium]